MDKDENIKLEAFVKKAVKEIGLEQPSANFMDNLLAKIEVEESADLKIAYTPLISKRIWGLVAVVILGIFGFVFFNENPTDVTWMYLANLNGLAEYKVFQLFSDISFADIHLSKTFVYGMVILSLLVCVQVLYLKKYFIKEYYSD
ncbi:MAG: hypothetical protein V3U92_01880 [Cellulophaga sp.]